MYEVIVTTTTPPVRVVCTGGMTATTTVAVSSTSVGLHGVLSQQDVLLSPPLILMDTTRCVASFNAVHHTNF